MNKSWQLKLYNTKTIYMLEAILLLNIYFEHNSFVLCVKHISLLAKKLDLTTSENVKNEIIKERIMAIRPNRIINRHDTLFLANSN